MTHSELILRYKNGERLFYGANLGGANLRGADLIGANLSWASLCGADLGGANLCGVNLGGANLRGANLCGANLRGSQVSRATAWPAPTMILLCAWGRVSDDLTVELMRYDASNHPRPVKFGAWAKGGPCPYTSERLERCANFVEDKGLWSPGPALSALELAQRLIRERCEYVSARELIALLASADMRPAWADEVERYYGI